MAKGAMIAGFLGLTCLPILGSAVAIIQGIRAYRNLSKYGITEGQSNAMAGIGLGIICLVAGPIIFFSRCGLPR